MTKPERGIVFYKSRIDWWIPAVVVFTAAVAFIGPIIDGEIFVVGIVVAVWLCILEILMFASVKYQICDDRLGIRNPLYKWEWFPIEKISEIRKTSGILSAQALSTKRVSIKFSEKKILKSAMPLEISPKDRDGFIARLKEINPSIVIKE
ncbi:MAG: PH domain-containing protein [Muribaculaceae bacterium]|nr:PH domain-containing protein [Muribaculaceae bacterium]